MCITCSRLFTILPVFDCDFLPLKKEIIGRTFCSSFRFGCRVNSNPATNCWKWTIFKHKYLYFTAFKRKKKRYHINLQLFLSYVGGYFDNTPHFTYHTEPVNKVCIDSSSTAGSKPDQRRNARYRRGGTYCIRLFLFDVTSVLLNIQE